MGGEPGVEDRRLFGPHLVAEPRAEESIFEHQPGVGGEDEVGQARLRGQHLDGHAERYEGVVQPAPLLPGHVARRCRASGSSTD